MIKYVFVKDDMGFQVKGYLNGKYVSLGNFGTKELAKEAQDFFYNECGRDIEKYKQSKYWKELRRLGRKSEEYEKTGSIEKNSFGSFSVSYFLNGKRIYLGFFNNEQLAREALNFFVKECKENLEEYKQSKYWKELRNITIASKEYEKKGNIVQLSNGSFQPSFFANGKQIYLGSFGTKELAQEALNYFIKECNIDLDKYKQSKYWLEKGDRRSTSKSYWEEGKMNKRNTSGVTGVRWHKNKNCWESCIRINTKLFRKYFQSKENAIKYRDFLVEQGKEFNEKWDEARKQKQMEFIKEQGEKLAKELKNNSDEKKAIEEEKQETQYEFTKVEE